MSFRDFNRKGPQPSNRGLRVNTQSRHPMPSSGGTSKPKITGLLYGKLQLVPSASYESSNYNSAAEHEHDLDDRHSLEHSSCSSASLSSQESSSTLSMSLNSNPHSPPRRTSTPSSAGTSSSRGMPGFSTQRRRRNRVDSSSSKGKPGFMSSPYTPSPTSSTHTNIRGWSHLGKEEPFGVSYADTRRQGEIIHATASDSFRGPSPMAPTPSPTTSQHHALHRTKSKKDSKYAELSTEVKHFQKMVAQLESLVDQSGDSPEVQWRSRILLRSAQEADRDIADKLYVYEKSLVDTRGHSKEARTAQTACMKLHRDFRRVHKALDATLQDYERRQQADISLLGANNNAGMGIAGSDPAQLLQQEQEDFFERAVREREEEVKKISQKMQKVNDIYQELAALVEGQQENIDAVEDNVQDAKDKVEGGLRHIEYARDRLCAMGDESYSTPQCGGGMGDVDDGETSTRKEKGKKKDDSFERMYPSSVGETEIFHWSMPFQTFHKDIKSVQKDIFGMGNGLASFRCGDMQCGSLANVSQCGGGQQDHASIIDDADSF